MHRALRSLPRPDAEVQAINEVLVSLAIGDRNPADASSRRKWAAADELLALDNGRWSNRTHIIHHCRGFWCCPNGIHETRMKIFSAVLATQFNIDTATVLLKQIDDPISIQLSPFVSIEAFIFGIKPNIPAVSRWTACGSSARYFLPLALPALFVARLIVCFA